MKTHVVPSEMVPSSDTQVQNKAHLLPLNVLASSGRSSADFCLFFFPHTRRVCHVNLPQGHNISVVSPKSDVLLLQKYNGCICLEGKVLKDK